MATVIRSLGITGISGYPLAVEVAIIAGLQTTTIVGLGDSAIKEAKDRMEACTEELGYAYPTRKVVVNLSPSDIKKRGAYLDLPMLIGMLVESGQVRPRMSGWEEIAFVGGLSTTGNLVGFDGVLPMAIQARKLGWTHLIVPLDCADEASLVWTLPSSPAKVFPKLSLIWNNACTYHHTNEPVMPSRIKPKHRMGTTLMSSGMRRFFPTLLQR